MVAVNREFPIAAPEMDAPTNAWIAYWVRVRDSVKARDAALARHAMREIKRLSKTVKPNG